MTDKVDQIIYYCDETSHKGDEFMAVGGLAINRSALRKIEDSIRRIRERNSISSSKEIKWTSVKQRRDSAHKEHADLLKYLVEKNLAHFHVRFQRIQDWDHKRSGPRRKIDTVSKAFYQLILHRPIRYYGSTALHIRPDKGECTAELRNYLIHLNTDAIKNSFSDRDVVRSIECRDSKQTLCLQLLDVTLGGLASLRNNRHDLETSSATKRELALHIHSLWENVDLAMSTSIKKCNFNIWNAQALK